MSTRGQKAEKHASGRMADFQKGNPRISADFGGFGTQVLVVHSSPVTVLKLKIEVRQPEAQRSVANS